MLDLYIYFRKQNSFRKTVRKGISPIRRWFSKYLGWTGVELKQCNLKNIRKTLLWFQWKVKRRSRLCSSAPDSGYIDL